MPVKWIQTNYPGVRYYEHKSRKHGLKPDRYYAIRYQKDGKRKEEGLGWGSDGWTAQKALFELAELKEAYVTGNGPSRLSDRRKLVQEEKELRMKPKRKPRLNG